MKNRPVSAAGRMALALRLLVPLALCMLFSGCQLMVYVVIENASREDLEIELTLPWHRLAAPDSPVARYLRGEWKPAHPAELRTFAVTAADGKRLDKSPWELISPAGLRQDGTGVVRYTLKKGTIFLVDIQSGFLRDETILFDAIAVSRAGKKGRILAERGMYRAAFSSKEDSSVLSLLGNRPAVSRLVYR